MNKTKLIKILKSFSKYEIKQFRFFVRSFYRNDKSRVLKLLEQVVKYYPEFESENFTKPNVFKKVYAHTKYNDAAFRKLISYLTELAEEFLIHQNLKKDDFTRNLFLLKELSLRGTESVFEQQAAIIEKEMKKYPRDSVFYYNRFRFLNIVNGFHAIRKRSVAVDKYQKEADSFFHYFLIEALSTYIYLMNEKKISNREFRLVLFNEVLSHLENNSYPEIISIPVYYNCLMLILTEDEKYFHALREIQKKLDFRINADELTAIYIVLENYCAGQVKRGVVKFRHEAFELQKEAVQRGLHLSGERIHIFTFLNIVSQASAAGEATWAENFIEENRHLLEPEYEVDAVNLSYAKCEFSKKEYEKALSRLGKINMEDSHFKFSVRTLMLMIYYELDLYDSASSMLDSYKHFITRDKRLPEADRENRTEFARYLKEILNLKAGMSIDTDSVRKNLLSTENIVEKDWFLEKITEISKRAFY